MFLTLLWVLCLTGSHPYAELVIIPIRGTQSVCCWNWENSVFTKSKRELLESSGVIYKLCFLHSSIRSVTHTLMLSELCAIHASLNTPQSLKHLYRWIHLDSTRTWVSLHSPPYRELEWKFYYITSCSQCSFKAGVMNNFYFLKLLNSYDWILSLFHVISDTKCYIKGPSTVITTWLF